MGEFQLHRQLQLGDLTFLGSPTDSMPGMAPMQQLMYKSPVWAARFMYKPLHAHRWVTTSCMMRASSYASVLRTENRWVIWGLSMRA